MHWRCFKSRLPRTDQDHQWVTRGGIANGGTDPRDNYVTSAYNAGWQPSDGLPSSGGSSIANLSKFSGSVRRDGLILQTPSYTDNGSFE